MLLQTNDHGLLFSFCSSNQGLFACHLFSNCGPLSGHQAPAAGIGGGTAAVGRNAGRRPNSARRGEIASHQDTSTQADFQLRAFAGTTCSRRPASAAWCGTTTMVHGSGKREKGALRDAIRRPSMHMMAMAAAKAHHRSVRYLPQPPGCLSGQRKSSYLLAWTKQAGAGTGGGWYLMGGARGL